MDGQLGQQVFGLVNRIGDFDQVDQFGSVVIEQLGHRLGFDRVVERNFAGGKLPPGGDGRGVLGQPGAQDGQIARNRRPGAGAFGQCGQLVGRGQPVAGPRLGQRPLRS